MGELKIKRAYDMPEKDDGFRILVDRLWPRGIKKDSAKLHEWDKDIAPGTDLRKWFNHEPEKFKEFSKLYEEELSEKKDEIKKIKDMLKNHNVTLIYGAKDPKINHAAVLKSFIENSGI